MPGTSFFLSEWRDVRGMKKESVFGVKTLSL